MELSRMFIYKAPSQLITLKSQNTTFHQPSSIIVVPIQLEVKTPLFRDLYQKLAVSKQDACPKYLNAFNNNNNNHLPLINRKRGETSNSFDHISAGDRKIIGRNWIYCINKSVFASSANPIQPYVWQGLHLFHLKLAPLKLYKIATEERHSKCYASLGVQPGNCSPMKWHPTWICGSSKWHPLPPLLSKDIIIIIVV